MREMKAEQQREIRSALDLNEFRGILVRNEPGLYHFEMGVQKLRTCDISNERRSGFQRTVADWSWAAGLKQIPWVTAWTC